MGKFKRYDGYVMHIPQEFIDSKLPVCPFCKSNNPHWLLDSRMEMSLAGSRTYYQCERCQAIMSSTAADAGAEKGKGFAINPAMAALNAAQKGTKHQEVGVAYMRVEDLGTVCQDASLLGQEHPITFFQEIAAPTVRYCSSCGTQLTADMQFCTACGTKQTTASAPVAAPVCEPAPVAHTVEAPVAHTVEAPIYAPAPAAAPAVAAAPYKFPLVPMIFSGLAALYVFYFLLSSGSGLSFVINILDFVPMVLMVLGLAICRKPKNVLYGLGFLAAAVLTPTASIISMAQYASWGIDVTSLAPYLAIDFFLCAPMALIGISYLVAKPGMRVLKLILSIVVIFLGFVSMVISMTNYPSVTAVISFVFMSVLRMLSAILYTPFKKA